jgi:hypothetical protein
MIRKLMMKVKKRTIVMVKMRREKGKGLRRW